MSLKIEKVVFPPVLNFAVLSGGELISKVFAFVAFAYLARVLGPENFGQLEFALALIVFFSLLVDCGLSAYGAREVAKEKQAVTRLTAHIVVLRCFFAVGAFTLLLVGIAMLDQPGSVKTLLLLYGLTLFGLPVLLPWVFQGSDLMGYVATASVIRWSVFAAGVLLCIRTPRQTWIVPLIEGVAVVCAAIFYFRVFFSRFGSLRQRLEYPFALAALRQALPIGASELLWALKMYCATVLLGLFVGGAEVGWFGAAHRLVISGHTFVWLYFFNLLPSLARCHHGDLETLRGLVLTSLQTTAWVAVVVGVVGTAFAEPIIMFVYGPQYHQSVVVLQVLIWLIPVALMSGHYRYTLIACDRQGLEFLAAACGAGLNCLLTVVLVPLYGLPGAAVALPASEVLIWSLTYSFVRWVIVPIPVWQVLYRPLAAGAVVVSVLSLLPPMNMWVRGSVAVAVYGLLLSVMQPGIIANVRALFTHH